MPSYTMLNVKMQRESNSTPWGFRMQGGRDFACPLQIQKVNPNSLAERCGMEANDYIVRIGRVSTEHLQHQDAQEHIRQQNNYLELTLQRGAPPNTADYNGDIQFPPHQLMESSLSNPSSGSTYRPAASSPQVAMPITNNRALLSQAHNTPIGLYSADNVTETITRTLKSSQPSSHLNKTRDVQKPVATLTSSDVEDLQQKYLYTERDTNQKNQTRQGPAFRALVRGLDDTEETNPMPIQKANVSQQRNNGSTVMGDRSNMHALNMKPDYEVEVPKNYNEFKATTARSMPKPAPVNVPRIPVPQSKPSPFVPSSVKPSITNKNGAHGNEQEKAKPSIRNFTKSAKGSALLNQNENFNQAATCHACGTSIRGPYISAIGHCYCVNHFTCCKCSIDLIDCGFVEENGKLYCESDFEQFLAPHCTKCSNAITKECVHAMEKNWHPECFVCAACKKSIGTGSFHVEEGQPYCIEDYRRMFQEKCTGCDFPIEPGDKYLEAMGGIYHVECFCCSMCQVSLDGQAFVIRNERPYCRLHAR